jgi:hypothetical protein
VILPRHGARSAWRRRVRGGVRVGWVGPSPGFPLLAAVALVAPHLILELPEGAAEAQFALLEFPQHTGKVAAGAVGRPVWARTNETSGFGTHKRTQPERAQPGIQRKQWVVDFRRAAGW